MRQSLQSDEIYVASVVGDTSSKAGFLVYMCLEVNNLIYGGDERMRHTSVVDTVTPSWRFSGWGCMPGAQFTRYLTIYHKIIVSLS